MLGTRKKGLQARLADGDGISDLPPGSRKTTISLEGNKQIRLQITKTQTL
jgi:hypothetical protein